MEPTFFAVPADLNAWLEEHHASESELLVGFYNKASGRPNVTYPESVQEALCFGWIDGIRKNRDESSYTIRFTPRKPRSIWSAVNIRYAQELIRQGRMQPAGLAAFEARDDERSRVYSFEQQNPKLDEASEKRLRANRTAWDFFQSQAPSYQRAASWWVVSAKGEETRQRRLDRLIEDSENGRRIASLVSPTRRK
jgi:uncharacterized protein YdeI (YjbR/CyaY-like superfamily)